MQSFSRGRLTFDVTDAGPPDGEVIVLLHGYPENRTSWRAVTPVLTAAGYRVLAPDQRGYSPGARPTGRRAYAMPELARDVVALLDSAGADHAHVVGHDWGGAVAWALATSHADRVRTMTSFATPHPRAMLRAMVTSDQLLRSWYMLFFQLPGVPELLVRAQGGRRMRHTLISTGLPADVVDSYVDPLLSPGAATAAINWYRGMPFGRPGPSKVTVPTLYVYPTADKFLGRKAAELTARYVSGPYRYEMLDGVSHWVAEEVPDAVAKLVLEHVGTHP